MNAPVKVWDKDAIQALIRNNDAAVARAIRQLYARQTTGEQQTATTSVANSRGFNANDARFLTGVAQKLDHYADRMTPRQLEVARRMLPKYWRQLLEVIEERGGVVTYKAPAKPKVVEPQTVETQAPTWGMF